ncbi:30S ribosomal protein S21 [Candidatus Cytomitobacter primus]|uniref:Small ribosomal subunit protein bS21 n=1 Tax=Candidatus Cytomitobacter primus TaxID=2066024 RepID=A0A5C0UGM5_9PROT|nr:30S ribosomal protein S21 [Candidatus Cytomitobacter primus]
MTVNVINNDVSRAMRELKKYGQRNGVFSEWKNRKYRLKPSEEKARKKAERIRRIAKQKNKEK